MNTAHTPLPFGIGRATTTTAALRLAPWLVEARAVLRSLLAAHGRSRARFEMIGLAESCRHGQPELALRLRDAARAIDR